MTTSGSSLEGLPCGGENGKRPSYEPGDCSGCEGLEQLSSVYEDMAFEEFSSWLHTQKPYHRMGSSMLRDEIEKFDREQMRPNMLLDRIVLQLYEREANLQRGVNICAALLQALHSQDYQGLELDLCTLTATDSDFRLGLDFGTYLYGEEDRALEAEVCGCVTTLASHGRSVDISFVGSVCEAGMHAQDSRYRLEGTVRSVGKHALNCDFYVPLVSSVPSTSYYCDYYVSTPPFDCDLERLRHPMAKKTFLDRKNTLNVPDGKGGWKEVEL